MHKKQNKTDNTRSSIQQFIQLHTIYMQFIQLILCYVKLRIIIDYPEVTFEDFLVKESSVSRSPTILWYFYDTVPCLHTPTVEEENPEFWRSQAKKTLQAALDRKPNTNVAKNILFFLGDGEFHDSHFTWKNLALMFDTFFVLFCFLHWPLLFSVTSTRTSWDTLILQYTKNKKTMWKKRCVYPGYMY